MTNKYVVYKHTSPTGKVYIGITELDVNIRWNNGRGYKTNERFFSDILMYGWINFKHEILFSNLSKRAAREIENELIKRYISTDPECVYNQCQNAGYRRSESVRDKIRASATKTPVEQYTLDHEFVARYESTREAARQTGVRNDYISRACKGGTVKGGFLWKYGK